MLHVFCSLTNKMENVSKDMKHRIVANLLICMDDFNRKGHKLINNH